MDPPRIELGAPDCKSGVLPLDYGPLRNQGSFKVNLLPETKPY